MIKRNLINSTSASFGIPLRSFSSKTPYINPIKTPYENKSFDAIVCGVGSMGASACFFLAQRNYKVLGLEQFDITHEHGAHSGQSRFIRKAYFEHPDYVPLLHRAYENWKNLENETGTQIYHNTGLVYFGEPDNILMKGVRNSASLYDIPLSKWDPQSEAASKRFSQVKIPSNFETLFEPDAGFVTPEKAIKLYVEESIKKGAEIKTKEKVIEWKKDGNSVTVITNKNTYNCKKLIITAGAWAGKMIPDLDENVKVTRQYLAWVKPKKWADFTMGNFPCWMIADNIRPGAYYGAPILPVDVFGGPTGFKVGYHYPGTISDPDSVNRQICAEDDEHIRYVLNKYMPNAFESVMSSKTCLYANTPDENFIIDRLPGYEDHVSVACGFSGHGFKFVSVVGEILADLAIEGKTKHPIGFLNAKRFIK